MFKIYEHILIGDVIGNPYDTKECRISTKPYMVVWHFGNPRGRETTRTCERENSDGTDFRLRLV